MGRRFLDWFELLKYVYTLIYYIALLNYISPIPL